MNSVKAQDSIMGRESRGLQNRLWRCGKAWLDWKISVTLIHGSPWPCGLLITKPLRATWNGAVLVLPGQLDRKEGWAPKNWCFSTVVLEKTLKSPLDCKEIQPVHLTGNQSWIFVGRTDAEAETPIRWPPDVKNWLTRKDPDAGKEWRQEKEVTEDEMIGWHHWLDGHEFE